jgi:hypothetical protein
MMVPDDVIDIFTISFFSDQSRDDKQHSHVTGGTEYDT